MHFEQPAPYNSHYNHHPHQPLEEHSVWAADNFDTPQPLSFRATNPLSPAPTPTLQPADELYNDVEYVSLNEWPPLSPAAVSSQSLTSVSPISSPTAFSRDHSSSVPTSSPVFSQHSPPRASDDSVSDASSGADVSKGRGLLGVGASRQLPRRRLARCACVPCRNAKTACDDTRPCIRCRTQRDPSLCLDRPGEEVERGRLKRRRKPATTAERIVDMITTQQQQSLRVAPRYELLAPYLSVVGSAPAHDSSCHSSAVCLAAVQSNGTRDFLVAITTQLVRATTFTAEKRKKAVRAIQLGLAHMADHMNVEHFNAFFAGQRSVPSATGDTAQLYTRMLSSTLVSATEPLSPLPLPASPALPTILRAWLHPTTRPVFLEWSSTPVVCTSAEVDPDADVATVRIRVLPDARANMLAWESQQETQATQAASRNAHRTADGSATAATAGTTTTKFNQQAQSEAQGSDMSRINAAFACLSIDDPSASAASHSSDAYCARAPRSHASWCSIQPLSLSPLGPSLDSSTLLCTCKDSVPLPSAMVVNAAWERLFGYSQQEVQGELLRSGMRVESVWFRLDSWFAYHVLLGRHFQSERATSDFQTFAIVKTKWGTELSCIVRKQMVCGDDGFNSSLLSFTPITVNA